MTHEKLDNLVKIGQLKLEEATAPEIKGLTLSLAALRLAGYRSENRYLVFQCLQHSLGLPNEQWCVLDQAHRKRNLAEYEGVMDVDKNLVEALIRAGDDVAIRLSQLSAG